MVTEEPRSMFTIAISEAVPNPTYQKDINKVAAILNSLE